MSSTLQSIKTIILALILALGISYVSAEWQNPTASPPNNNTPAPLNEGSVDQTKVGGLDISGLIARGGWFKDFLYTGPSPVPALSAGDIRGTRLCIGSDCRDTWPSGGTGGGGGGGGGTVTSVGSGPGLSGGPITSSGSIRVNAPTCTTAQKLLWNGTAFTCATDATGAGGTGGGTVTSLSQGNGIKLTPNPIVGAGTIAADTSYLQRRDPEVSTKCAGANLSIKTISADGKVTCETDDAGTGGGGDVTGTGAAGRLAFWTGAKTLSSDNALIWDSAKNLLTLSSIKVNGTIDVTNGRVMNVATPTTGADAANKAYVDSKRVTTVKKTGVYSYSATGGPGKSIVIASCKKESGEGTVSQGPLATCIMEIPCPPSTATADVHYMRTTAKISPKSGGHVATEDFVGIFGELDQNGGQCFSGASQESGNGTKYTITCNAYCLNVPK